MTGSGETDQEKSRFLHHGELIKKEYLKSPQKTPQKIPLADEKSAEME